jgi:hypothetical protein
MTPTIMTYRYRRPFHHDDVDSPAYFNRVLAQIHRAQQQRRSELSAKELVATARLQLGEFIQTDQNRPDQADS